MEKAFVRNISRKQKVHCPIDPMSKRRLPIVLVPSGVKFCNFRLIIFSFVLFVEILIDGAAGGYALTENETFERQILTEFYQSTAQSTGAQSQANSSELTANAMDWTNSTGWRQESEYKAAAESQLNAEFLHVCEWYGVQCDWRKTNGTISERSVVALNLAKNNIVAAKIPSQVYSLPNLKLLNLHGNIILNAGFPTSASGFQYSYQSPLEYIDFSDCMLNDISGISIFYVTLKELHLSRNEHLGTATSFLNRTVTAPESNFPLEILELQNLVSLSLSMNNLKGTIPEDISKLTKLSDLDLNMNMLTGTVPTTLKKLEHLQILNLGDNLLSGPLDDDMIPCNELRILNIRGRYVDNNNPTWAGFLSGPLPSLQHCRSLHTILLGYNRFNGSLPADFLQFSEIGQDYFSKDGNSASTLTISLTNNDLIGEIPTELARFDVLVIELIGNTRMTGPISDELCDKERWMRGLVGRFGCDAILCSIGTYNDIGQQVSENNPCIRCSNISSSDRKLGATFCNQGPSDLTVIPNEDDVTPFDTFSSPLLINTTKIQELSILAEFYVALDGPTRWINKDGWEELDAFFAAGRTFANVDDEESAALVKDIQVCSFYGIICNSKMQVNVMTLSNNGMVGTIPNSLFLLPELFSINFSYNRVTLSTNEKALLSTDVPSVGFSALKYATKLNRIKLSHTEVSSMIGISEAVALSELFLDGCDFESTLPTGLFSLTTLSVLHLEASYLKGTIPREIGKLTNLRRLNLNENQLSGTIPREISLLTSLENLDLSDNAFSNDLPPGIGNLRRLLSLRINSARGGLGGPLPSFSNLSQIEDLELAFNDFTGTIPEDFLDSRASELLLKIRLTGNSLTGTIPTTLARIKNLVIELEDNKITGLPDQLCQNGKWMGGEVSLVNNSCDAILCPKGFYSSYGRAVFKDGISCLPCPDNIYFGETVCETSGLKKNREVEILDLLYSATGGRYWNSSHTNWTKPGVPICYREGVLCGWKPKGMNSGVTELRLSNFGLRGQIPTEVFNLPQLRRLSFANNPVDIQFTGIAKAEQLEVLNMAYTNVKNLSGIQNAGDRFFDLHLAGAGLMNTFPSEILQLVSLRKLFLEDNRISGPIPPDISNLKNLQKLGLNKNDFTGSLPPEIGLLTQLDFLDVSLNQLSGIIPAEIGKLTRLTNLNLAGQIGDNRFVGPLLPFATNPLLTYLNISGNALGGTLPPNLLALTNNASRITVDLSRNSLTGSVPVEFRSFETLFIDLTGNKIKTLPAGLCNNPRWMNGIVGIVPQENQCDAILCKPGTYSSTGRQIHRNEKCKQCDKIDQAPYFGSFECGDVALSIDRHALTNFYEAMSGESWINNENWLSDLSVCTWYGVDCDTYDSVIALRMESNNLQQIQNDTDVFQILQPLRSLRVLVIDENNVNIDFRTLDKDSALELISVNNVGVNRIDGISRAQNLQRFIASNNKIIGSFPSELLQMKNLVEILLSGNLVNGSLPSSLSKLSDLQHLLLQGNALTGQIPTEIGELTHLKELVLSENFLTGSIPSEVAKLPELERFSARAQRGVNQISGILPDFSMAKRLWFLDLSENSLTGTIPSTLLAGSNITNRVIEIVLDDNLIHGAIPVELKKFARLDLRLSNNRIDSIPSELCEESNWMKGMVGRVGDSKCDAILCPKGTFAEFGRQSFEDRPCQPCGVSNASQFMGSTDCSDISEREVLSIFFANTSGLKWSNNSFWMTDSPICSWFGVECQGDKRNDEGVISIDLFSNGLSGSVPSEFWLLPNLQEVRLGRNPSLSVSFESLRKQSSSLEKVDISETRIETLTGISMLRRLKSFTVSRLSGPFPTELLDNRELEFLNVSFGYLVGTIPSRLCELSRLTHIYAIANDFHGPIPKDVSNLSNLKELVLDENLVSGLLPGKELASLFSLERLSVSRKWKSGLRLTGSLPELNNLQNLAYLALDGNTLTGVIPDNFLASSRSIKFINLTKTDLSGTLPRTLESIPRTQLLVPESLLPGYVPLQSRFGDEKEILQTIYKDCGGKSWIRNDFWESNTDICSWYGVGCSKGRVVLLNLQNNNLHCHFPPRVFLMEKIQALWLSSNSIDIAFTTILSTSNLRDMKLDNTNLSTLTGIEDLIGLTALDIGFNNFEGKLFPSNVLMLPNLRVLRMSNNGFVGGLPTDISKLQYLRSLDLSWNAFNGSLPAWNENVALLSIKLNNNNLTGQIPADFLYSVPSNANVSVFLENNGLTGLIPNTLRRFDFDIQRNPSSASFIFNSSKLIYVLLLALTACLCSMI